MAEGLRRIGVLTSGGDAPGMNAAVRAVVRTGLSMGLTTIGIDRGYEGLLEGSFRSLTADDVGGILDRGGTFLGTSRSKRFATDEGVDEAARILNDQGIEAVVLIGGDGTFRGGHALASRGVRVVGVPATIDNDVAGTDTCIGFDTALNTIADAVSKVRDTASSLERTFVIEVMGRKSGNLAVNAGAACGADCVLVPEVPFTAEEVSEVVRARVARGKKHTIIILAEGAGEAISLSQEISCRCGHDARAVVLGHVQRGGSPSVFDRTAASRMGAYAVKALVAGEAGKVVGLVGSEIVSYPMEDAFSGPQPFNRELYDLAKLLAI